AYVYDIASNTWIGGPLSPLASVDPADAVIGGQLYMIGGSVTGVGSITSTFLFDPDTGAWSAGPNLNVARSLGEAATINTPGGQTAIALGGPSSISDPGTVEASTAP